ncbi:hypothetical protein CYMTET_19043 [Cymbomonas tetramitiformis]|uniref:SCD domain-containing protein n=1 Tax=Cymbomonas tetramitiformis TaxID=36881 RepID=A0AAE0L5K4_9CHLO|nr:hypothetical protein CYMTET_19043 [Cymbomonas tetramitiformis]
MIITESTNPSVKRQADADDDAAIHASRTLSFDFIASFTFGSRDYTMGQPARFMNEELEEGGNDEVSNHEDGSSDEEYERTIEASKIRARKAQRMKPSVYGKRPKEGDPLLDIVKVANKSDLNSWGKSWNLRLSQDLASALAEVVTFLAKSCSCDVDFSKADIDNEDVEGIVKEVVTGAIRGQGQATSEDPFGKKNKQCRQFKINYELVWDIIVREIYSKAQSTSALLILVKYAVAFSQCNVRPCRVGATLAALQLVTSFISLAKQQQETRETVQRQLHAEERRDQLRTSSRLQSLRTALTNSHEAVLALQSLMKQLISGVFVHRYRDIDDMLRTECISSLGHWCGEYQTFFLKDTYLKYLGWSLNDKVASVRIAALTALQKLYDMEQNHTPLDTFTTRFKTRILEMTCDICPAVGVKALGVLTRLIREELVEVTDCDRGFLLLIDDSPQLRLAAAELVTALVYTSSSADDEAPDSRLNCLLQLISEYAETETDVSYIVDALWENNSTLKDWRNILRVLLTGDEQLSEADKTNLVFIFSRCVRKGTGESLVPGMNDKKPLTKTQKVFVPSAK